MKLRIIAIPLFQDNYSYIFYQNHFKQQFPQSSPYRKISLIDPADPKVIIPFLNQYFPAANNQIKNIFYTHKHWDHAGQCQELLSALQQRQSNVTQKYDKAEEISIFIGQNDKADVPTANKLLKGEENIDIFGDKTCFVNPYFVPCHTKGHIIYHCRVGEQQKESKFQQSLQSQDSELVATLNKPTIIEGRKVQTFQSQQCMFTGDTIFCGGVGRFFEGNAEQMVHNIQLLDKKIGENKQSKIDIFNGHEYTYNNLKWAAGVETENQELQTFFKKLSKEVEEQNGQPEKVCCLPTTWKREKGINLFVRAVTGTYLHEKVSKDSVELMKILREMKNKGETKLPESKASL